MTHREIIKNDDESYTIVDTSEDALIAKELENGFTVQYANPPQEHKVSEVINVNGSYKKEEALPAPTKTEAWEERFGRRFRDAWKTHGMHGGFYTNLTSFIRTEIAKAEKRVLETIANAPRGEAHNIAVRMLAIKAKTDTP